jgi:urate oxidase
MEAFAQELIDFLLHRNEQVTSAEVSIASTLWKRLTIDGKPHPDSFMRGSGEQQTTRVERAQNGTATIVSGLADMVVMKTAHSAFAGFIRDELTTLPETQDRLFATAVRAEWPYTQIARIDFEAERTAIREAMLRTFASHDSRSVQQTLYAMGEAALAACSSIDAITLTMPNIHCIPVDLARFGQQNTNQIFMPTDDPHGTIEATIRRG